MTRPCGSDIREAERHVTRRGHVLLLDPVNLRDYTRRHWDQGVCPMLVGWRSKHGRVCRPGWEEALAQEGHGKSPGLKRLCRRIGVRTDQAEARLEREGRAWAAATNPPRRGRGTSDQHLKHLHREWLRHPSVRTLAPLANELQRRGEIRPGPVEAITMGEITDAMDRLGLLMNPPRSEERRRQLLRAEGPEARELAMLELNRQGRCARCAVPQRSMRAYRSFPSGREARLCDTCATLSTLEEMEQSTDKFGGYLGERDVHDWQGFPLVRLDWRPDRGGAGFGGRSYHWRGVDRYDREWYGWNGSGEGFYTNMTLRKASQRPGRDVYQDVDAFEGRTAILRVDQDQWLDDRGAEPLPFRFNPEEGRRRRARSAEGPEALLAQINTKKRQGQELTPLEWLVDTYGRFDLMQDKASPGGYTPAPNVIRNRGESGFVTRLGENYPHLHYYRGQHGTEDALLVLAESPEDRNRLLNDYSGLVLGEGSDWIAIGYPDMTPYRQAWGPYVLWLRHMGGARERLTLEFLGYEAPHAGSFQVGLAPPEPA